MNAFPAPWAMTIAKAINAQIMHNATAGARATTDPSVRARISQCVGTIPPTIAATEMRLKVARIGLAAAFWPNMPRSTIQALLKVLARKNTQVTLTSV